MQSFPFDITDCNSLGTDFPRILNTTDSCDTVAVSLGSFKAQYSCLTLPDVAIPYVNPLRTRQNCRHFADDTFKPIFLNGNIIISIKISLKFLPKIPTNNMPALVQIMACADQATSHYLNQWWSVYWRIYASFIGHYIKLSFNYYHTLSVKKYILPNL